MVATLTKTLSVLEIITGHHVETEMIFIMWLTEVTDVLFCCLMAAKKKKKKEKRNVSTEWLTQKLGVQLLSGLKVNPTNRG